MRSTGCDLVGQQFADDQAEGLVAEGDIKVGDGFQPLQNRFAIAWNGFAADADGSDFEFRIAPPSLSMLPPPGLRRPNRRWHRSLRREPSPPRPPPSPPRLRTCCPVPDAQQPGACCGRHAEDARAAWSAPGAQSACRRQSPARLTRHPRHCRSRGQQHDIGDKAVSGRCLGANGTTALDHHACCPLVTDERAAKAGEFFKQQADQARQIDPAFTGIEDGARLRDGAVIEARRHGRDARKTTNIGRSAGAAAYCHGPKVRATLSHSKD